MPIKFSDKECQIPRNEYIIEGVESGLFEDLTYRPNKYIHPVEEVSLSEEYCTIQYKKELHPLKSNISLLEIQQLLAGTIDAFQRKAQDQIFYLFPGLQAFGTNNQQFVRIALINVRPKKDLDEAFSEQKLSVEAFLALINEYSPEARKKIVNYNKPIFTLRHLQDVLTSTKKFSFWKTLFLLLVLFVGTFFILRQWGPPKVRQYLQNYTKRLSFVARNFTQSGTDSWFETLRKERLKKEYIFNPIKLSLLLQFKDKDEANRLKLSAFLMNILEKEFSRDNNYGHYRLLSIKPNSPNFQSYFNLCKMHQFSNCEKGGWLLIIDGYKGGLRPLRSAIEEFNQQRKYNKLDIHFLNFSGAMTLQFQKKSQKPSTSPKARKTPPKILKKHPQEREEPSPFAPNSAQKPVHR